MLNRRHFLTRVSVAGGVLSWSASTPALFTWAAEAARREAPGRQRSLLVVFLRGGNDGLNTVVPFKDPSYARLRKELHIGEERVLKIDESSALHPSLRGLAELWEAGRLAIVHGVGYPGHNRSHFVSTAVWHAARLDATPYGHDGWIGRALDAMQARSEPPLTCSVGLTEVPRILSARHTRCAAPPNVPIDDVERLAGLFAPASQASPCEAVRFVEQLRLDAARSLQDLAIRGSTGGERFPDTELGRSLAQVAWLIANDNPARVYYVEQDGYDTHAGQTATHAVLLRELGDALRAFDTSVRQTGDGERITTLVFSEFGRRAEENASGGTDHGTAGPVFVIGGAVCGGTFGERPNLENLTAGDVAVTTDFRRIYATLLTGVLNVKAAELLGQQFEALQLLSAGG